MGSALRAATAASQASALREVMNILEQPAWRRLERIRKVTPGGKEFIPRCCVQTKASRPAAHDCDFAFQAKDVGEVVQLHVLLRRCHGCVDGGFEDLYGYRAMHATKMLIYGYLC